MAKLNEDTDAPSWWQRLKKKLDTSLETAITDQPEEVPQDYVKVEDTKGMRLFEELTDQRIVLDAKEAIPLYVVGGDNNFCRWDVSYLGRFCP